MRIYHFLNKIYGLQALTKKRIKVSRIMELNDPFEFLHVQALRPSTRHQLKSWKRYDSKETGLICFSKNWRNPVLWAHYAEQHKGLCLGFDVPYNDLIAIEYIKERTKEENFWVDITSYDELIKIALSKKFQHWEYEEEYRSIFKLESCFYEDGLYFKKFDSSIILKEVILGCRSSITFSNVRDAIGANYPDVRKIKTQPSHTHFSIVNSNDNNK